MAKKTQPKKEELQVKPAPQPKLNPLYKKFLETCSMNEKKVYSENLLKGAGVFKKYVVELEDAELAKLIEG